MKLRMTVMLVATLAVLLGVGVGDATAQCGTDAGCGDANCSACASTASAGSACASPAVAISLDELSADELKLVRHIAGLIESSKRVEFDIAAFAEATGLSEETITGFDQGRIESGIIAELQARDFDTSKISFGAGNCSEFGACSVDRNLSGASGELLESYQTERASNGKTFDDWTAPDFTLPSTDGKEVSLSDFRGKRVALMLLATHCNHCYDTMPFLAELRKTYADDIVILPVLVNASSVDDARKWIALTGAELTALVSTDKSVSKLYETELVPATFLIDEKGYVTKKFVTFQTKETIGLAIREFVAGSESTAAGSR